MHAKKRAEEEVIEALSDDKTIRLQTPTVISTVGSGVGKSTCSTLRSIGAGDFSTQSFNRVYILLTPYRHAASLEMTVMVSRSHVISTAAKRSGEIPLLYGTGCIGAGDFSTQSFNRVYILLTLYRHAAPLEMTVAVSRFHVISTVAKRSGEISLLYAAWLWCLSRLPACRYVMT